MNVTILNISLLLAWLLITIGGVLINIGAGLVASGITLAAFTLLLALRFGVYVKNAASDKAA